MYQEVRIGLLSIIGAIFVISCDKKAATDSSSANSPNGTAANGGGDMIVTGQLSVDSLDTSVKGDNIDLKQREVAVVDDSGKTVAKALTGSDGSYVVTVPGSLVVEAPVGPLKLAANALKLQSIIADTKDESVIGINDTLDPGKGHFQNLGKNELQKITAIRGKITLDGAKDHSGIVVYIPGTSFDARTDVSGNFLMTFISAGSYQLKMEKDGYISAMVDGVVVSEKETAKIDPVVLKLSGGTSQFTVKQVGKEGFSQSRTVDFIISPGNADRFKAGLIEDVETMPYDRVVDAFRYEFPADGEYTLKFAFANADGFESQAIRTIVIDTQAPSAAGMALADRSSVTTTYTNELSVIAYHSTCLDIDKVAILPASSTAVPKDDEFIYACRSFADDSNANFRLPANTTTFSYQIWVMDKAGNKSASAASGSIIYDNVRPSSPIATLSDQTSGSALGTDITTVNVTFANCNDIAKVVFSESQTTPPASSSFVLDCTTTANAYTYTFYTNQPGTKTVYFWSMDAAGNIASTSTNASIILDQTEPTAPSFTLADPTSNITGFTNDPTAVATIANCNDVKQVLISNTQSTKPTESTSGWQNCALTGVVAPITGQGNLTVYLWAKDIGGNISTAATTTTIVSDITPPVATNYTLTLKDSSSNSTAYTNSQSITFTFSDCTSESVGVYLSESSSTPSESDFTTSCAANTGTVTGSINLANATNGSHTLHAWVKDQAGNISTAYISTSITLDTVNPSLPATFTLADSDTASTSYTNSTTMNFTVDACPAGDFVLMREGQTTAPSENDSGWLTCALTGSVNNVVTSGNGLKTVYLWKKDSAGNIAGSLTTTTTWDGDAPNTPIVTTPATYNSYVQSTTFAIAGTAEANALVIVTGGASTAQFNVNGSGNFSGNITLNSNQVHYLAFQARDAAGNTSISDYKMVEHDIIPPTISSVQMLLTDTTATISWVTDDESDSQLDYGTSISYGSNVADTIYTTMHSLQITGLTQNTTYYFRIRATDQAGNTASANNYTSSFKTYISKSGTINSETWNATDTAYYLSNHLTVAAGQTLTIGPGVNVKMAAGKSIIVNGIIAACGTVGSPITIRGNQLTQTAGYWGNISFASSSTAPTWTGNCTTDSGNRFEYVTIEGSGSSTDTMNFTASGAALSNVTFAKGQTTSVKQYITMQTDSQVIIRSSSFSDFSTYYYAYGILVNNGTGSTGKLDMQDSTFTGVNSYGARQYPVMAEPSTYFLNQIIIKNNTFNIGGGDSSNPGVMAYIKTAGTSPVCTVYGNRVIPLNYYVSLLSVKGSCDIQKNFFTNMLYSSQSGIYWAPSGNSQTLTVKYNIFTNNRNAIGISTSTYTGTVVDVQYNSFIGNSSYSYSGFDYPYTSSTAAVLGIDNYSARALNVTAANNLMMGNSGATLLHLWHVTGYTSTYNISGNNILSNSTTYNVYTNQPTGTTANATNTYWGTTTVATIDSKIYDYNDDAAKGTVNYTGYLSAPSTTAPMSPPQGVYASPQSGGTVTVNWTANPESNIAGYKIYYDTDGNYPYANSITCPGAAITSCNVTGLTPSSYYYFFVTVYRATADGIDDQVEGNESYYSNVVPATAP